MKADGSTAVSFCFRHLSLVDLVRDGPAIWEQEPMENSCANGQNSGRMCTMDFGIQWIPFETRFIWKNSGRAVKLPGSFGANVEFGLLGE